MLQPSLLCLLIGELAQRLPFAAADLADTDPGLLQHLHLGQRSAGFSQLAQLRQVDGHGELAAKLDVDEAPARVVLG